MKTALKESILFIVLSFFSISIFAQTELPGAIGLTFGMNTESVKGIMLKKNGVLKITPSGKYTFTNITVGTKKAFLVMCSFIDNKLYDITIYFSPDVEAKTQELYDELKGIIVSKYGEGESFRHFKGIYSDGDGYEMQAVKTGNADIVTYWSKFINQNAIALEIYPVKENIYVKLSYQDDKLASEAELQESAKNKTEF